MQLASTRSMAWSSGVALWAVAGVVLYVLTGMGSLLAIATVEALVPGLRDQVQAGTIGLSIQNGVHPLVWGAIAAAIAMPVGRRLVPTSGLPPAAGSSWRSGSPSPPSRQRWSTSSFAPGTATSTPT